MHRLKHFCPVIKSSIPYTYIACKFFSSASKLQNAGPVASLLKSRSVVRFRGPDTVKFLQGLLTNDVRRFGDPVGEKTSTLATPNMSTVSEEPMYAAMLNPQGRFLYDMFLYRPSKPHEKLDSTGSAPGSDQDETFELFMDVDATVLDELLDTFKKYRLRSKVEIENVAEEFSCWQRYGGDLSVKSSAVEDQDSASIGYGGAFDKTGMSCARGNDLGWQWFGDPRLECLGFRGIFPSNQNPPLVEADKETDELNYLLWRVENGVAEGSTEIPKGEAIPLEYNLVGLNAISFDKGCYVGQEFIARTHHRGVIRKRLLPLRFLSDCGEDVEQKVTPGSDIINTASNKKVGIVTTALGARGLGLLRLDEAFKQSNNLTVQNPDKVKVQPIRPEWWPADWVQDQQEHSAAA
ncbi:unnamed protein product [Rhodiola kirilowii]